LTKTPITPKNLLANWELNVKNQAFTAALHSVILITTLSNLGKDEHMVTAYSWNTGGNVGASETIVPTVAAQSTFPTNILIAFVVVALVGVVYFGLLAFITRLKKKNATKRK